MSRKIFKSEEEVNCFLNDCLVVIMDGKFIPYGKMESIKVTIKNTKILGYIEQSELEKAEEFLKEVFKNTTCDVPYYKGEPVYVMFSKAIIELKKEIERLKNGK